MMSSVARDAQMIDVLIHNDFLFITENEGGIDLLYHILEEGHPGYSNLSTTELEDELMERGLPVPDYADEL
jgi:hypothetical protein